MSTNGNFQTLKNLIKNNQIKATKNNNSLIKAGDERALAIYNEYNQAAMTASL